MGCRLPGAQRGRAPGLCLLRAEGRELLAGRSGLEESRGCVILKCSLNSPWTVQRIRECCTVFSKPDPQSRGETNTSRTRPC